MPNIKSAKKRVLIAKERTEANKASKTALKTVIKKARAEGADAAEGSKGMPHRADERRVSLYNTDVLWLQARGKSPGTFLSHIS